jgi:hypothetical protein
LRGRFDLFGPHKGFALPRHLRRLGWQVLQKFLKERTWICQGQLHGMCLLWTGGALVSSVQYALIAYDLQLILALMGVGPASGRERADAHVAPVVDRDTRIEPRKRSIPDVRPVEVDNTALPKAGGVDVREGESRTLPYGPEEPISPPLALRVYQPLLIRWSSRAHGLLPSGLVQVAVPEGVEVQAGMALSTTPRAPLSGQLKIRSDAVELWLARYMTSLAPWTGVMVAFAVQLIHVKVVLALALARNWSSEARMMSVRTQTLDGLYTLAVM